MATDAIIGSTAVDHDSGEFYTVNETAARLNVSPSTIWRWIQQGRLLAFRFGPKSIRVPEDAVEAAIKPVSPRWDEPTMMDAVYANHETTFRPLSKLERQHGRASIVGLRSLQDQMRLRRGGEFLPDSVDLIHEMREKRSKDV